MAKNSMDLYYIGYVARCFSRLMRKRYLINSDELVLDWRPLFETYERLLFSKSESLGLLFVPENLESNLSQAIRLARPHFPITATQEMLDEWRPMLCPFSDSIQRAVTYMNLFLPTTVGPEHHDKGFKLWFDEVMQLWLNGKFNSPGTYESKFTLLLSRLSSDCLGYIDWEPYIPKIFNHFKISLNLNGSSVRTRMKGPADSFDVGPCVQWIVYMINQNNSCLDHVFKLFKAIESFYHPSNADRRWHTKLQQFLHKLPACYVKRLYRERHKNNIWSRRVPESHRLTDEQTSRFVDALMPVVLTSMFNQLGMSGAALAFRDLSVLRPEKVVPPLLDRLYGSYETLTEPHRLLASINCMASVVPAMVRPCKYFPEGPTHVVPLLVNSLPGIDSNDMRKCIAVFRFIATIASHVRMKDYSYLVDDTPDLSYPQQQLCLSTGQFEDFVVQFLDKCFVLIENTASAHSFTNSDHDGHLKNGEEGIIEAAISSVTLSILAQASPEIQQAALDKLYSHVTRHIFDTKTQGKAIATLCLACAKAYPKATLAKFVPHFGRLTLTLTENGEVNHESHLDDELLFSLLLLSEIVRCNSPHLLDHKEMIVTVLQRALSLKCKDGYMLGCSILRHLLRALTNIASCDWRNIDLDDDENRTSEEKWPFDNWGHTTHIKDLKIKWEIPGPESRQFAQELLELFLKQVVEDLLNWSQGKKQLCKEEVQRSLHVVLSSLVGASSVLPSLESKVIDLCPMEVPVIPMFIKNTGTEPIYFSDGTNIRTWVVEATSKMTNFILEKHVDDTKSLTLICEIFATSISYFGYNKSELRLAAQRIKSLKNSTQNKLLGSKRHLRYLLVERVAQQHRAMLMNKGQPEFTQLHLEVFKQLFELSVSHYVEVRILAQDTVYLMMNYFPFSESILVPMLVEELRKPEIEHKKFKGLLHLVLGRRSYNSIAIDLKWSHLLWPALVESPHSEKPSVIKLLERVSSLVIKGFDTFGLRINFPDRIKRVAEEFWTSNCVDLEKYQPPDEQLKKTVKVLVDKRNDKCVENYESLILKLVELIENPHLHWQRRTIAYSLSTCLMRDDHPLPLAALNLCLSSLISDRLLIRTKAVQLVSAQLKLQKRKHIKRTLRVIKTTNTKKTTQQTMDELEAEAGKISINEDDHHHHQDGLADDAQLPLIRPEDTKISGHTNKWLQYKLSEGHYTREEWDRLVFLDKPHLGFYEWPSELEIYEPYEKQPKLNRPPEELNPFELAVYTKFNDPNFVKKFVDYLCFEDNKGSPETHRFDRKRLGLFKGLFRNFGPCMLEPFKQYVVEYATSSCEHKQKFVIEFLAGLIRGSKHWSYDMLNDLKLFVLPLLDQMTVSQENYNDWNSLSNYVFWHRDAKRLDWLLHYFITKATSQSESTSPTLTPFIQASRLTLAFYALIQCEWRAVDHIFPRVVENLMPQDHLLAYANVRNCLSSIYSLIYMFDDPNVMSRLPGTIAGGPKRIDFVNFLLPKLAILEKKVKQSSKNHLEILKSDNLVAAATTAGASADGGQLMITEDDDTKSRYLMAAAAAAVAASTTSSMAIDNTETSNDEDQSDVVKILSKIRAIETNSGSNSPPSSSSGLQQLQQVIKDLGPHHRGLLDEAEAIMSASKTTSRDHGAGSFVDHLRDALPSLNVPGTSITTVAGASTDLSSSSSSGAALNDEFSQERKNGIKLMKLTSFWIIYNVFRMKSPIPPDFFKLLPIVCELSREASDPELANDTLAAVYVLGYSTLSPEAIVESLKCVRQIIANHSWHARSAAGAFIEVMITSNLFNLIDNDKYRAEIEDIVINHLICDERIEVRESSLQTLSGMIHCEFTKLTPELLAEFKRRSGEPLIKRKQANGTVVFDSKSIVIRHSGVLCLCACVDAYPYSVPDYLPGILTLLSDHLTDPQPISVSTHRGSSFCVSYAYSYSF